MTEKSFDQALEEAKGIVEEHEARAAVAESEQDPPGRVEAIRLATEFADTQGGFLSVGQANTLLTMSVGKEYDSRNSPLYSAKRRETHGLVTRIQPGTKGSVQVELDSFLRYLRKFKPATPRKGDAHE